MFDEIIDFIQTTYKTKDFIGLHDPYFKGNERDYVLDCINSSFVSSVGQYVTRFENEFADFLGAKFAVAVVNGTAALHLALIVANVRPGDEVITQPLTFVATCNAISYCQASPLFIDVNKNTLGLCSEKLTYFLENNTEQKDGSCYNKLTGKRIGAVVPMHTFGHPVDILAIHEICKKFNIPLVEDAAESLGSYVNNQHTGTFGLISAFSFNGNKTITTGGGGMIVTNSKELAHLAKHLSTTAKIPHAYEYYHDQIGFNYRMPNINAALGVAQLENLEFILNAKKKLSQEYSHFFERYDDIEYFNERVGCKANFWLNTIIVKDRDFRNSFLEKLNSKGVMVRPIWQLMNKSPMYSNCYCDDLSNSIWLEDRVVNIPSSVR